MAGTPSPPTVRSRGESLHQAAALAGVGGFLDAYTYLDKGGVFANAQTGNIVLFASELASGHPGDAWRHVPPFLAFILGLLTVEVLARSRTRRHRPTRLVLGAEMAVFTAVGLLPATVPAVVATVAIAWAATLQVGTFRGVRGASYATTFTTGNLRSLVSESVSWLHDHDAAAGPRARALAGVVAGFAVGGLAGGLATHLVHHFAVLITVPVLAALLADIVLESRRLAQRQGP